MSGSGISWAICKSAPYCRQITTPAPHHSVFTGRMPFLPPNQQRQSTEGKYRNFITYIYIYTHTQLIRVQSRPSAVNMTLPAFAVERCHLQSCMVSIDISCPQGAQQQTRCKQLLLLTDGTDERTLDRFTDPAPHTMQVVSITIRTCN